jgi:hypothetical protein
MIIQANQVLVNGEPMSLMQYVYETYEELMNVAEGMIDYNFGMASLSVELVGEEYE